MTVARPPGRLPRHVLALLLAAAPAAVLAQTSFRVGLVSDYRYRGISLSDSGPAAQIAVNHDTAAGFYFGAALSGARLDHTDANAQAVAYAGYAQRLGTVLSWEAGLTATAFNRASAYDYQEVFAGIGMERLGARLYFSPHYAGVGGRTVYAELNGSYPLSDKVELVGHAGYLHPMASAGRWQYVPPARADLQAGVSVARDAWTVQLAWVATRDGAALYPGAYERRARRWVLSTARVF